MEDRKTTIEYLNMSQEDMIAEAEKAVDYIADNTTIGAHI